MTEVALTSPSIDIDTLCIRCGYNLRGLSADGQCPECGAAIQSSIRGDVLRFADRAWLDQLRLGVSLKLWNIALAIIVSFATGLLVGALRLSDDRGSNRLPCLRRPLGVWASWALIAQEPRISLHEDPLTLRRLIRWGAALVFLGSILSLAEKLGFGTLGVVLTVCAGLLGVLGFLVACAELVYLRRFAVRIPDDALAKSTRSMFWNFGVLVLLGAIMAVFMVMVGRGASAGASPATVTGAGLSGGLLAVFAGVGCFFGGASLVALLGYVRLLTKFKKTFQQAAAQAHAASMEH